MRSHSKTNLRTIVLAALALVSIGSGGCGNSSASGSAGGASSSGDGGTSSGSDSLTATGGKQTSTTGAGGSGKSGSGTGGSNCVLTDSNERPHPGVFDYESCTVCHGNVYWGGWVYSNALGDAWVANATVTLEGADGSTVAMHTAKDGFFSLKQLETEVPSVFTPCVSRCADRKCATKQHKNADCQSADCHGSTGKLIYLGNEKSGNGGTTSTGTNCVPPASGGPRVHDSQYDGQTCAVCHDSSYVGGYVYDGVTSTTPVSMATVTLTPEDGSPIKVITGPGGMFQVPGDFNAPYKACVSKCPDTRCSSSASHPNTDDCATCHNEKLRIHVP